MSAPYTEIAPAKLNLALHVRGRRTDGRHDIETMFAFCADGDRLTGGPDDGISLEVTGPFAVDLEGGGDNLVLRAAHALQESTGERRGAKLRLVKNLPVASGLGGGSADAAAALRLLTAMWGTDPGAAQSVAPALGSDVPACLLSLPARGSGAGDELTAVAGEGLTGTPVVVVNPRSPLSTAEVFARWDGTDRGPLGDWRQGRNDLESIAVDMVPQIGLVLAWLSAQQGAQLVRMSGSGASCFALFGNEADRNRAEEAVPREWWKLATWLR